jgi:hypothetical protein
MKALFADTCYFIEFRESNASVRGANLTLCVGAERPFITCAKLNIALLDPADEHHALAREYTQGFGGGLVTTPWVLAEVGNAMCLPPNRGLFVALVNRLRVDKRVLIVPAADEAFERGFGLFGRRPDKEWGLTDCISFAVMEERGLREALTADRHFEQAGFTILLK